MPKDSAGANLLKSREFVKLLIFMTARSEGTSLQEKGDELTSYLVNSLICPWVCSSSQYSKECKEKHAPRTPPDQEAL
jgi:hypothetical protein